MGPGDLAIRSLDYDIGEISALGTRDSTGVKFLKNGVPEALLNRVLCQALEKRWVLCLASTTFPGRSTTTILPYVLPH